MGLNISICGLLPSSRCLNWFGGKRAGLFGSGLSFLCDEVTEAMLAGELIFLTRTKYHGGDARSCLSL